MDELDINATSPQNLLLLTPEGYARLHKELETLTVVKRAEIAERLRDSKQHGEFSEDNSELDEVKFEQAMVENRIAELKAIFAAAQQLETKSIPTDQVGVGSYVTVRDEDRKIEFEVRMVASIEADPDNDLISVESPMGLALFGRKLNETVEFEAPAGNIRYKIVKIRR
jgi:transcription elongation factor GreA